MTTPAPVHFEPLPPDGRRNNKWHNPRSAQLAAIANQLAARPGEWARLRAYTRQSSAARAAARIRHGQTIPFQPAGTYEAVTRRHGDEYRVYARYVGVPVGDPR